MKKLTYTRKKLADGFEDDILEQKFIIQIDGKSLEFKLNQFYNNSFNEFNEDFEIEKNKIAKNEGFLLNDFDGSYQSLDKLEILYLIKESILFLFSYGEFQPARYQLYLEGVYDL